MSQVDTRSTPHAPARVGAGTSKPRWRRGGAQPRPTPAAESDHEPCEVARLAQDAAKVLKLKTALRADGVGRDNDLIDALEAPDDGVRPDEMQQALFDRLKALADIASHLRATSLKGALYQLYLAASVSQHPEGRMLTPLSARDKQALAECDRKATRLHYGAIAHLESLALDGDLQELRRWYLAPDYDIQRACDRATSDRAALVAEARGNAARDAATRIET